MLFVWILFVRVCMSVLSWSWYVPDETWQSTEVAHHTVYGTGYITWEWLVGIRSSLHPLLFTLPLAVLKATGLDSQYFVVLVPKLTQALLTTLSEYLLIRSVDHRLRGWLATLLIFNWHTLYTGSRTLVNTVEYCITCAAMSLHNIWKKDSERSLEYLPLVGLGFMLRPTSALLWAPICMMDAAKYLRRKMMKDLFAWILVTGCVMALCIIIDSIFYAKLILTPFNFFIINVYKNLGVNYGTHPWHWYVTAGLPSLLGPLVLPLVVSLPRSHLNLLLPILVNLTCLSVLPHKEMRFLQSSLPFLFLILAENISSYRASYQRIIKIIFLVLNICGALYLSTIHQRGVVDAALYIGKSGHDLTVKGDQAEILILMPCHSTPLYSHIHQNISVRFLECTPNLENDPTYREEADIFYLSPDLWIHNLESPPDILIYFDILQSKIQRYLQEYDVCTTFFHTMFPEGRIGGQVIIAARRNLSTLACNNNVSRGSD
jgi:phosphatidylinositol glycan class B